MILTDHTITAEINNGNIVVEPFIPENLGTNSIDLTLSNTLVLYTESVLDVRKKNLSVPVIIPPEGIILQPGIVYLASTVEYTETLRHVPVLMGKWTLELIAVQRIKIYPGMKIAQIVYHEISEMPKVSYDKKEDAKYSNQGSEPVASKNYLNK